MTVTYTAEVATVRGFGCFLKLLFRWRGSIYKLVWPDLMMFLGLYYILNFTYRFVLEDHQKRFFESVVDYCETYSNLIPLSFVLGFYVSIVMQRWWDQYNHIPWPDPLAVYVSSNIHGQDERGRLMRRTIMRYCCLCLTMTFTMISPRVKKRFPTVQHFVEAGLMLENEKAIIADLDEKFPRHAKHWLPIVWAASIVTRARKEGRIRDDFAVKTIIDELNTFRGMCGQLLNYDAISVPLVYTQVVTLAVYSFFATSIMGGQWVDRPVSKGTKHTFDLYFPIFTTLQFFFYMGWLKVAESLINPFGEDDDDFEVNWLVDRNLQVSYLIVDEMHHEHPELIRDQYWDEVFPTELPYTVASEPFREQHPKSSTANIEVPKSEAELTAPSSLKIDELSDHPSAHLLQFDDNMSGIHFTAGPKRSNSRISHRERTMSGGSQSSFGGSMANSINRVASITSVLKTIFSRENSQTDGQQQQQTGRMHQSLSSASLQNKPGTGTIRITDQVIEEVDEQSTVTSVKRAPDYPNVKDIFPQYASPRPPASQPVNVPMGSLGSGRQYSISTSDPTHGSEPVQFHISDSVLSSNVSGSTKSAPYFPQSTTSPTGSVVTVKASPHGEGDHISIGSSTDNDEDEFTRLKTQREEERKQRLVARLARSISAHQAVLNGGEVDTESLLADLSASGDLVFPPHVHGDI